MTTQTTRWSQFGVLITVFFFWGFVAASNDILIPVFKKAFNLTQAQSQYVAVAFYVAYTVGSLIYVAVSKVMGLDLLNRIGYKNGICLGLVISALTQREQLTEIVELPQAVHPWYVGVQFHPEFKSTPWNGHPLFNAFVKAAVEHQHSRQAALAA
mgnify:CR=1 FL=1